MPVERLLEIVSGELDGHGRGSVVQQLFFRLAFVGLGEPALEDRHRHAQEDRVAEQAERPDAEADQRLVERRAVFDHLAQRRGDEARE